MPDIAPLSAAAQEQDRKQRLADERAAIEQFGRLNGALELQAAVLALLLPSGSKRAARAWEIETEDTANAEALRAQVKHLSAPARLPQFEALVSRMRGQPLAERQNLLEATRRVMGARGTVRPIDRLHWLAMRQRLGGPSGAGARNAAAADLSLLPQADVSSIAMYSAFLSRIVPVAATEADSAAEADVAPGAAWYATAMTPWHVNAVIPPCQPPDSDGLVQALQALQALPWMQRPMLVRGWVTAAIQHSRYGRLDSTAADALRLSAALLDSPLPPELARHYGVVAPEVSR
ncbi:MAG: hypothetical protein ABI781_13220 [Burkholderiales bacterium]